MFRPLFDGLRWHMDDYSVNSGTFLKMHHEITKPQTAGLLLLAPACLVRWLRLIDGCGSSGRQEGDSSHVCLSAERAALIDSASGTTYQASGSSYSPWSLSLSLCVIKHMSETGFDAVYAWPCWIADVLIDHVVLRLIWLWALPGIPRGSRPPAVEGGFNPSCPLGSPRASSGRTALFL